MEQDWLTIENDVLKRCSTEARGEIVIPQGVKCIDPCAFERCDYITSVIMPDGLTRIGYKAFYRCYRLESIIIPESVIHIESDAFDTFGGYSNRIKVILTSIEQLFKIVFENSGSNPFRYKCDIIVGGECVNNNLIVPDSVETINENALLGFYDRIVFPKTIKRIEKQEEWNSVLTLDFQGAIPEVNNAFESCRIKELWVNMPRESVELPKEIKEALDFYKNSFKEPYKVIYSSPKLCEELSLVPGYIKVTKAYGDKGRGNDADELIDINTKYIVSVKPVDIERYRPVKGSIIRCAANGNDSACEYTVYEPCDMVLQKIDTSLRMLSEQVGGVAGLLNQLETLCSDKPIK